MFTRRFGEKLRGSGSSRASDKRQNMTLTSNAFASMSSISVHLSHVQQNQSMIEVAHDRAPYCICNFPNMLLCTRLHKRHDNGPKGLRCNHHMA